jgi:hypothetical protein
MIQPFSGCGANSGPDHTLNPLDEVDQSLQTSPVRTFPADAANARSPPILSNAAPDTKVGEGLVAVDRCAADERPLLSGAAVDLCNTDRQLGGEAV